MDDGSLESSGTEQPRTNDFKLVNLNVLNDKSLCASLQVKCETHESNVTNFRDFRKVF